MRNTYIGQIKDGKLILSEPKRKQMAADISRLRDGRYVELEVRPLPRRSNSQNAYYWGVVVSEIMQALQELGHEVNADLTHELLKTKFNAKPLINADGEVIAEFGDTTTKMNKTEFGEYLDKIKRWSAQYLNLIIPEPGEQREISFETTLYTPIPEGVMVEKG